MTNHITYLLGAGASCLALPMVKEIENSLNLLIKGLSFTANPADPNFLHSQNLGQSYYRENGDKPIFNGAKETYGEVLSEYVKSLKWLKDESSKHFSIDTYAKKLYLQEEFEKLKELKVTLSCFFTFLQNTSLDNRYDSFFASILESLNELPERIKILSWNYDYQPEIGFANFLKTSDIADAGKKLNVVLKNEIQFPEDLVNKFCVFKINGTTKIKLRDEESVYIDKKINVPEFELLNRILLFYHGVKYQELNPLLSFAWEEDNRKFYDELNNATRFTTTLIVIGYSFPFFNRKIDLEVLSGMKRLQKIYIQDPYYAEGIEERIKSIIGPTNINSRRPYKFQRITDLKDQFYIPFEL